MHKGNVLVVEDDDVIRRLLVDFVTRSSSAAVQGARDGVEALHLISTRQYTVVVLDVMMPKMSGVDLLDSLQAMLRDPSVHNLDFRPAVIVVTATAATTLPTDKLKQRFPELVHDVFRKPVDMSELGALVNRLLGESAPSPPAGARPQA